MPPVIVAYRPFLLHHLQLILHQLVIIILLCQQLLMSSTLHYYSMPHYQYLVGILYGAQTVRCHNRSPPQSPSPYVLVFPG